MFHTRLQMQKLSYTNKKPILAQLKSYKYNTKTKKQKMQIQIQEYISANTLTQ